MMRIGITDAYTKGYVLGLIMGGGSGPPGPPVPTPLYYHQQNSIQWKYLSMVACCMSTALHNFHMHPTFLASIMSESSRNLGY